MTPEYETTFDSSRMGAEHKTFVAFCEALLQSARVAGWFGRQESQLTEAFLDCASFGDTNPDLGSDSFIATTAGDVSQLAWRRSNCTQEAVTLCCVLSAYRIHLAVLVVTYTAGWHTGQQLGCYICGCFVSRRRLDVVLAGACLRRCGHRQCNDGKRHETCLQSTPKVHRLLFCPQRRPETFGEMEGSIDNAVDV